MLHSNPVDRSSLPSVTAPLVPPVAVLQRGLPLLPQAVDLDALLLAVALQPPQLLLPLLRLVLRLLQTGVARQHRLPQSGRLLTRVWVGEVGERGREGERERGREGCGLIPESEWSRF